MKEKKTVRESIPLPMFQDCILAYLQEHGEVKTFQIVEFIMKKYNFPETREDKEKLYGRIFSDLNLLIEEGKVIRDQRKGKNTLKLRVIEDKKIDPPSSGKKEHTVNDMLFRDFDDLNF